MNVRILLVDDHAIVREGLRYLLQSVPEFTVVAEAASGREALRMIAEQAPEVVVMDISMPDLNGIEATREIRTRWPQVRVIILSVHSTLEHVHQAFAGGACSYVLKESIGRELINAIRTTQSGKPYVSKKIEAAWGQHALSETWARSPLESLSTRERQVLQLVVEGRTSAEIAGQLALSPKTVETYRSRLMQKLGMKDITALVKFAIQHGVTTLG